MVIPPDLKRHFKKYYQYHNANSYSIQGVVAVHDIIAIIIINNIIVSIITIAPLYCFADWCLDL